MLKMAPENGAFCFWGKSSIIEYRNYAGFKILDEIF